MHIWLLLSAVGSVVSLRCYEGTVDLDSNLRTNSKNCPVSTYCVQKINKDTKKITRECASWTDEHSMEEKCPMSGCHWQSKDETYCCCQYDLCNEYKADGNLLSEKEVRKADVSTPAPTPSTRMSINPPKPANDKNNNIGWKNPSAHKDNSEISID